MIHSVAGDIYAKLKELSVKIQRPKFRKILQYVDDLLNDEMNSLSKDDCQISVKKSEDAKKLRSLITLLFMIKINSSAI